MTRNYKEFVQFDKDGTSETCTTEEEIVEIGGYGSTRVPNKGVKQILSDRGMDKIKRIIVNTK